MHRHLSLLTRGQQHSPSSADYRLTCEREQLVANVNGGVPLLSVQTVCLPSSQVCLHARWAGVAMWKRMVGKYYRIRVGPAEDEPLLFLRRQCCFFERTCRVMSDSTTRSQCLLSRGALNRVWGRLHNRQSNVDTYSGTSTSSHSRRQTCASSPRTTTQRRVVSDGVSTQSVPHLFASALMATFRPDIKSWVG